ncbi:MAG: hypothetical protein R3F62_23350 [Planctomycetota bacterium]
MATELSPPPVAASAELSARDWQRRCQAVLALARRLRGRPDDAPELEARLLALALDPQWQVREEVAVALELAEHPDTDGALEALAGDGASAVARAAKRALRERRRLARAAARRGERVAGCCAGCGASSGAPAPSSRARSRSSRAPTTRRSPSAAPTTC